jgi:hypothetical protein
VSRLRDGDRVNHRTRGKGEGYGGKDEQLVHDRTSFSLPFTIMQSAAGGVTGITSLRIFGGPFA